VYSTVSQAATTKRLASFTAPRVTELARTVTGDDKLEAASWEFEPLAGGFGSAVGGTALYRLTIVSATGQTCSLVLKILYERRDEAPSSPYYWKREYEAYRSGLLEDLPADTFSTPRIYDLNDFGDSCWIWMEDVEDCKDRWSLADFRNISARLGRFNGAWLTGRAPPGFNWLSRNWHSAIAPGLADSFASLDQLLDTSLARRALPLEAQDEIMSIWRDRRLFQDTLAQLPRTLCHTDAFRRNILHRRGDVVLLDWALASVGAIGEELVCLVAVSLYYEGFSADDAEELDKTVFSAYVGGLRQAGWNGDAKLARLGFTCGMVLRGLAGVKQDLQLLRDQAGHAQLLRAHGMSNLQDIARLYAEVRRFRLLKMAVEARDLLSA